MFEFPWTRKRRLAEKAEADRIAKLEREKQERRNAQILADQIHRSQLQAKFRAGQAGQVVTPIKPANSGLTAQKAAQEDRKRREDDERRTSHSSDSDSSAVMAMSFYDSSSSDSSSCDTGSSDSGSCGSSD